MLLPRSRYWTLPGKQLSLFTHKMGRGIRHCLQCDVQTKLSGGERTPEATGGSPLAILLHRPSTWQQARSRSCSRGMCGRGSAVILGPWLPILRGQCRGESCRSGPCLPGPSSGGPFCSTPSSLTHQAEVGGPFRLKGTGYHFWEKHDQGSKKEAFLEYMTPPVRPPLRWT
ncbi:uncharacterized protein LOC117171367 isoform X2 [Belonocnema kinseyi]|uniref:uncharacterized protein LOC117171367 isoform X2 n=1 Tax=Belonocnema kinseyi TaxID=2817044 RepID=UPI00143D0C00|nr:uncharacterized protein LOC117171367 isoform X2 [Belonocnema kinseyi]